MFIKYYKKPEKGKTDMGYTINKSTILNNKDFQQIFHNQQ